MTRTPLRLEFALVGLAAVSLCSVPAKAETSGLDPHWFTTGSVDVGFKYLRPRLSLGHGKSRQEWLGVDINPLLSNRALGIYSGFRLISPIINFRTGALYIRSSDHSYLPVVDSYTRESAELIVNNEDATYWASLTEFAFRVPLFGGVLRPELELIVLRGVPANRNLFEETQGVVTSGPWLLRTRIVYTYPVASVPSLHVGGAAEHVRLPGRPQDVWRAGAVARFQPLPDLGFRFSFLPVLASPDTLGLVGTELEFGIRWFWLHDDFD